MWTLNRLNADLAEIDGQIKKAMEETPQPEDIVEEMQLFEKLEPLKERRDLLKIRYFRQAERAFNGLIVASDED